MFNRKCFLILSNYNSKNLSCRLSPSELGLSAKTTAPKMSQQWCQNIAIQNLVALDMREPKK